MYSREDILFHYDISEDGAIRFKYGGRFIKTSKLEYETVHLNIKGKPTSFQVHRLVAMLYVPNPENKPCVNHIDCNKLNNHHTNLEWCTHAENTRHAIENGLIRRGKKRNPSIC